MITSLLHFADYYTSTNYNDSSSLFGPTNPATTGANIGIFLLTIGITLLFIAGVYVVTSLFLSRIFKKAGIPGWIAWVPFYNSWKTLELGGQQGFWAVLAILPLVNYVSLVFTYIAMYHIGLRLGKSGAWVVLAIFVPIVWYGILAFDSSKWDETPATAA
jgi:hypothetical protein